MTFGGYHASDIFIPFRLNFLIRLRLVLFFIEKGMTWRQALRTVCCQLVPLWSPGVRRMPHEKLAVLLPRDPQRARAVTRLFLIDSRNLAEPIRKIELAHGSDETFRGLYCKLLADARSYFTSDRQRSRLASAESRLLSLDKKTVLKMILSSPTVVEEVRRHPHRKAKALAQSYADEIVCNRYFTMIRACNFVLKTLVRRAYRGLHIDGLENITSIDPGHKIIYLPTHRSHLDFLLFPLLLFRNGIEVPQIASSNHLNRPFLRPLIHASSGYFIRRRKMDAIYNAVLFEYLKISQREGTPEMVFIEGTRSKIGETLQPKSGMLSQYIDAYLHQQSHPIAFVPVNITYDRVLERSYFVAPIVEHKMQRRFLGCSEIESLQNPDAKPLLEKMLKGLLALRREPQARVYIHCGEPIFLETFLQRRSIGPAQQLARCEGIPHPVVRDLAREIAQNACEAMNRLAPLTTVGVASLLFWQNESATYDDISYFTEVTRKIQERSGIFHRHYLAAGFSSHDLQSIRDVIPSQSVASSSGVSGYELRVTLQDRVLIYLNQRNIIHGFILPSFVAKKILMDGVCDPRRVIEQFEREVESLQARYHVDFARANWQKKIHDIFAVLQDEALVEWKGDSIRLQPANGFQGRRFLESLARLSAAL